MSLRLPSILTLAILTTTKAEEESTVQRLGVNFAIPADAGDPGVLARQAAALGVTKIKLFDYSPETIYQCRRAYSLAQKKVEIMVAIPQWISNPPDGRAPRNATNVAKLLKTIRDNSDIVVGVFVYNEPCINGFCVGQAGEEYLSLLNYLADELKDEGKIVTTPFSMGGILQQPPHSNVLLNWPFMKRVVAALAKTNAPVAFNVYPYLDYIGAAGNVELSFALGTAHTPDGNGGWNSGGQSGPSQIDWDLTALRQALNSLGEAGVNTPIMIGETGWAHNFGEDPGPEDYWMKRVYDISNYNDANTYYSNLAQRLPGYVEKWNLQAIYVFGLADEPTKPLRNPACSHGQPIDLWVKFQCGAYHGERWFGITGLWQDTSKSPWNQGGSQQLQSGFPSMRKEDWKRLYAEKGQLEWVKENQPENAKIAGEKLKEDAQLIKRRAAKAQEQAPAHYQHHAKKEHHHGQEQPMQKWQEAGAHQPIASEPLASFSSGLITVALAASAAIAAALALALVVRRGRSDSEAGSPHRLLQGSADTEMAPLEACLDE